MNKLTNRFGKMILTATVVLAAAVPAFAQVFNYQQNDLILGFRKTGTHQANFELVVDIGQGSNYTSLAAGASIPVPNYTTTQLTPAAFPDLNFLNWSVLGDPDHSLSGYPNNTLWLTVPRTSVGVQSTPPPRLTSSEQAAVSVDIASIFDNAVQESSLAAPNVTNNTATSVREPINDSYDLSNFVGGKSDPTISDLQDNWVQNVEITTPSSFTSAVRSDLYEVRPTGVVDPHTGQTSGNAYFVGYFELGTSGAMTFTRASVVVAPPATRLTMSRAGNTTTIKFPTTNNATYTLYYTNTSGLNKPTSTWPSLPGTVTGNGLTNQFTDTTTDSNRVYRIGAH